MTPTVRDQLAEQAGQITELRQEVAELRAHLAAYRVIEFGHADYPRAARRPLRLISNDAS